MFTFIFQFTNAVIIIINNNLLEAKQVCGIEKVLKLTIIFLNLRKTFGSLTFTSLSLIMTAFQGIMHFTCFSGG